MEKKIDPAQAKELVSSWRKEPTKERRDSVWLLCIEASKAVIGKLQKSHKMRVKDYDDKVVDGATKLMQALDKKPELVPNNIVSWAYLYVLGVVFSKKLQMVEKDLLIDDYLTNVDNLDIECCRSGAIYTIYGNHEIL